MESRTNKDPNDPYSSNKAFDASVTEGAMKKSVETDSEKKTRLLFLANSREVEYGRFDESKPKKVRTTRTSMRSRLNISRMTSSYSSFGRRSSTSKNRKEDNTNSESSSKASCVESCVEIEQKESVSEEDGGNYFETSVSTSVCNDENNIDADANIIDVDENNTFEDQNIIFEVGSSNGSENILGKDINLGDNSTVQYSPCLFTLAERKEQILLDSVSKPYNPDHPLITMGFSLFKLPTSMPLPKVDLTKRVFTPIFNNYMSANKDLSPQDDRKRFHSEINEKTDENLWKFHYEVCNYLKLKLTSMPTVTPLMLSLLGRENGCKKQVCHKDGEYGYFVVIPLTENYEIGVVPYSHMNYTPELDKWDGDVVELPRDQYKCETLKLNPGEMLLARRSLVHFGGPSRDVELRNGNKFTDVAFHGHLVFSSVINNQEETFDDQVTTHVKFYELKDYPETANFV